MCAEWERGGERGRTQCKLPAVWLVPWQCVAFSFKWLPHKVIEMWPWSGPHPSARCLFLHPLLLYSVTPPLAMASSQFAATCLSWQHLKELTTGRDYSVVSAHSKRSATRFLLLSSSSSSLSSSLEAALSSPSSFSLVFCRLVSWFSKVAPKWPHFDIFLWPEDGLQLRLGLQPQLGPGLLSTGHDSTREWVIHVDIVCNKYLMPTKNIHIKSRKSRSNLQPHWRLHLAVSLTLYTSLPHLHPSLSLSLCLIVWRFSLPFLVFQLNFFMTTSKLYHNSKCFDMSFVSLFPARSAMQGNFSFLLENALAFLETEGGMKHWVFSW